MDQSNAECLVILVQINIAPLHQAAGRVCLGGPARSPHAPVAKTIDRNPLGYARNQNASYLVERVLSSGSKYQESLLSELSSSLVDLALSRYGCYVARAVVDHPKTNRPLELSKLTAIRHELNKTKHGQYLLADLGLGQKYGSKKHVH